MKLIEADFYKRQQNVTLGSISKQNSFRAVRNVDRGPTGTDLAAQSMNKFLTSQIRDSSAFKISF